MYASNLLLTMAVLAILIAVCVLPLFVDGAEDQGDGRTYVRIPGYERTPPHRPRTWAFGAISAAAGLLFLGWKTRNRRPCMSARYGRWRWPSPGTRPR